MAATRTRGRPPKLAIELLVVAALMAAAAIGIYLGFRSTPVHDVLALGGRNVDVSDSSAAQFEPSIAREPAAAQTLLAASMDDLSDTRIYVSTDGGAQWRSRVAPGSGGACALSHPAVAFARRLEVYAAVTSDSCQPPDPRLIVATRNGVHGGWRVRRVGRTRQYVYDERPSLAVDAAGTIYVAWPRVIGEFTSRQVVLLSRSSDGGATWSRPVRVGRYRGVYGVDLAAVGHGVLYLAVSDGLDRRIDLLRSSDGGSTWSSARRVGSLGERFAVGCGAGATQVPAQPQRCVSAVARVALSPRSVSVVYGDADRTGFQAVYVSTLDRALHTMVGPRVVGRAGDAHSDQFLPTVAYDATTGDLWVCFYDTRGDSTRKHAWYTCTVSRDGGRTWAQPVHAASAKSDETETGSSAVGYGDVEGLVAWNGAAHPVWTDNRNSLSNAEDIYTAAIPASRLRP